MKDLLTDPKFARVVEQFTLACQASRMHSKLTADALRDYDDHGPQISGCIREHFPEHVKDDLRMLASEVTKRSDAAHAARPARVRKDTIIKIGRMVARRDGSGFYGPRAA